MNATAKSCTDVDITVPLLQKNVIKQNHKTMFCPYEKEANALMKKKLKC